MDVELRPMREDEFTAWLPLMQERYAADMVEQAGMSPERAAAKAAGDVDRLFPGHVPAAQHSVYVIEVDGEPAGDLWLTEREETLEPCLFVYDVRLAEQYRGRGYGRAAMLASTASPSTSSAATRWPGASTGRSATRRTPSR
jgi:GNAT superfamily N-acetyltransferase